MKTLRLPTGNNTGEFQSLYNQYPTYDQMRKYPVGMVLGGRYYWSDGALNYQGTIGYYWSSSAYTSANNAYNLLLRGTNSTVTPANYSYESVGFSLRCLAQNQTKNKKPSRLNKNKIRKTRTKVIPKSFRLPTGGPSGEYQTLYNNYNSWTAMTNAAGPQFVLGGWRYGTSPDGQDTFGYYWSSLAHTSATYAHLLALYGSSSTVRPEHYGIKLYGFSLRCLAQKSSTCLSKRRRQL